MTSLLTDADGLVHPRASTWLFAARVAGGLLALAVLAATALAPSARAACSCQGAMFLSKPDQSQIVRVCRNPDGSHTEEVVVNSVKAGPLTFGPDGALWAALTDGGNDFSKIIRYDPNTGAPLSTFKQGGALQNAVDMQFGPDGKLYVLNEHNAGISGCNDPFGVCGTVLSFDSQGNVSGSFAVPDNPGRMRFGPNGSLYVTTGAFDGSDPIAIKSSWTLREYNPNGTYIRDCLGPAAFGQTGNSGACFRDANLEPRLFDCNPYSIEAADPMNLFVGDDCGIVRLVSVAPDGTCAVQGLELNNFQNCGGVFCAGFVVVRHAQSDLRRGAHPPFAGDFLHAVNVRPDSQSGVDCTTAGFVGADVLNLADADFRHATPDGVSYMSMALQQAVPCEDNDPCTDEVCGLSGCEHIPRNCDDGNPCTDDSCNQAAAGCVHVPAVCQPQDQCHDAGTCSLPNGCSNPAKADGASCNDVNGCTVDDACVGGACAGTPAPAACDPTASAGSLVGGASRLCDGGTVDANDNCVIQAGGVTLEIPLGGPPFAVNPPRNISIINHTPGSPCPFFSVAAPAGRQVSCTEFLPQDFAFGGGKTGRMTFGWLNTGTGGFPSCSVDTDAGSVFEGTLGIFRDGVALIGRKAGVFTADTTKTLNRCAPGINCPTGAVAQTCNDQTLCLTQTCDPVANTLTVEDKHFSEYAIGLPCGEITKPRLRIAHLGEHRAGRFSFAGYLPDASPQINPVVDGIAITLNEPTGTTLDLLIPGGAYWRAEAHRWTYVNYDADAPGGINRVLIDAGTRVIRFKMRGQHYTYDASTAVRAAITLGSGGQCFEADFGGPSPLCQLRGSDVPILICR